MKTMRLTHPALLAPAMLVLTPFTVEHELVFSPAPDTTVTRTMTATVEGQLDDMSILVDGNDLGQMLGAFEMSMMTESELVVTDTYLAVADGRPTKLKRTFDTLSSNTSIDVASEMGGDSQDVPASSPLEGATVIYTWDPEAEAYDVAYEEEGAGDDDLLIDLIEDLDLRTMLPAGPVEVGDSWTVDTKALAALAMQGQSLHLVPDEMGAEETEMMEAFMTDDFKELFEDLYDGTLTLTLKGMREVDGEQLADVDIAMELSTSMDMTEMLMTVIATAAESQGEEMPPIDFSAADLNVDFEGQGVMIWNLGKKLVSSVETTGDFNVAVDISGSVEEGGQTMTFDASLEMSGNIDSKVGVE